MLYLGIDQHAKQLTLSLRGGDGNVIFNRQVSTEPERCLEFFTQLHRRTGDGGFIAIVEVCGFNDWLLQFLPQHGCGQVVLIQPEKKPKVKTDRRDAHTLSELLWVNRDRITQGLPVRGVRQIITPSKIDAENQRITMLRRDAGRARTRTINQIKHILRRHNLQWLMPTKSFPSVKAIAWLKSVKLPSWDRTEMDYHLEELARLTKRMLSLEATITARAQGIESVELLRTIPGCGYYTALALACRIGDATRFPRGKSLSHYWGLTPGVRDSGDTKGRRGHITKAGSTMARVPPNLMEQIVDTENLETAWARVKANRGAPGPDGIAIGEFPEHFRQCWPVIRQQLLEGTYKPGPVRRKSIPKPDGSERHLGIPNVIDRLIQQAVLLSPDADL